MNLTSKKLSKNPALVGIILFPILIVVCLLAPAFILLCTKQRLSFPMAIFITRALLWLLLAFMFWYTKNIEKQNFLLWRNKTRGLLIDSLSAIVVFIVLFVGMTILFYALKYFGLNKVNTSALIKLRDLNMPLKLYSLITAAVFEELVFRAYLLPRLQSYFKTAIWPIIISSVIFALTHSGYGTIANVIGPLFIGIIFARYYHTYRNIYITIICHFFYDCLILLPHH